MRASRKELLMPASFFFGSLAALILLMLLTSPVKKIGFAIAFFGILLVALISLGNIILRIWGVQPSSSSRYRIFVISLFIVISMMFRSAQSFDWVDGLIVILVAFGLLFYGSRRF